MIIRFVRSIKRLVAEAHQLTVSDDNNPGDDIREGNNVDPKHQINNQYKAKPIRSLDVLASQADYEISILADTIKRKDRRINREHLRAADSPTAVLAFTVLASQLELPENFDTYTRHVSNTNDDESKSEYKKNISAFDEAANLPNKVDFEKQLSINDSSSAKRDNLVKRPGFEKLPPINPKYSASKTNISQEHDEINDLYSIIDRAVKDNRLYDFSIATDEIFYRNESKHLEPFSFTKDAMSLEIKQDNENKRHIARLEREGSTTRTSNHLAYLYPDHSSGAVGYKELISNALGATNMAFNDISSSEDEDKDNEELTKIELLDQSINCTPEGVFNYDTYPVCFTEVSRNLILPLPISTSETILDVTSSLILDKV